MNKLITVCISIILTFSVSKVFAETNTTKVVEARDEHTNEFWEDTTLAFVFPLFNSAIEKHYGKMKRYDCPTIVVLQKVYPATFVFEMKLQARKYEGALEPPFELMEAIIHNREGVWSVKEFSVKPIQSGIPNTLRCRAPVTE